MCNPWRYTNLWWALDSRAPLAFTVGNIMRCPASTCINSGGITPRKITTVSPLQYTRVSQLKTVFKHGGAIVGCVPGEDNAPSSGGGVISSSAVRNHAGVAEGGANGVCVPTGVSDIGECNGAFASEFDSAFDSSSAFDSA